MGRTDRRLHKLEEVFEPESVDGGPVLEDALLSRMSDEELDWVLEPTLDLPARAGYAGGEFDGFPEIEAEFMRRVFAMDARREEILKREPRGYT